LTRNFLCWWSAICMKIDFKCSQSLVEKYAYLTIFISYIFIYRVNLNVYRIGYCDIQAAGLSGRLISLIIRFIRTASEVFSNHFAKRCFLLFAEGRQLAAIVPQQFSHLFVTRRRRRRMTPAARPFGSPA